MERLIRANSALIFLKLLSSTQKGGNCLGNESIGG